MRFAVVGAGAIGAYVGASLTRAGYAVTLLARGAHLAAMREYGVRVQSKYGDFAARPAVTDDIAAIGPVDVVLLALKAHHIAPIVDNIRSLFHSDTAVVAMQNGIPWWYFMGEHGPHAGRRIVSADPDGRIGAAIESRRVVGCVIYSSTEIVAPGVIQHVEGTRYILGDPVRGVSERTRRIAESFVAAGLQSPVEADIRVEIWTKLLGNATFNPISVLTRATIGEMCDDPVIASLVASMMRETVDVAAKLCVTIPVSIEQRIDRARRVGAHRTSMLQDLQARKSLELDALVGAIVELGKIAGVPAPVSGYIYGLCKLLERSVLAGR